MNKIRCGWVKPDPHSVAYHDHEWGVPQHDDRKLFEQLVLSGAQAGLSWLTVLRKRENYRNAFDDFDIRTVAGYDEGRVRELLADTGLIRNRGKIIAAIENAKLVLRVQKEAASFDAYLWQFIGGAPRQNAWETVADIPPATSASEAMSRDLKRKGFRFVGPTICYAFMQAVGMVNDHTIVCFRYDEVASLEVKDTRS